MKSPTPQSSNRWLAQELDRIYSVLSPNTTPSQPPSDTSDDPANQPSAIDELRAMFGLSGFESDLLLLCLGVELESRFGQACAAAQNDPRMVLPTFGLALSCLAKPHWSAISRARPLRYWRFINISSQEPLLSSPLRIDERIAHFLLELPCTDERLESLITPLPMMGGASPSHAKCADLARRYWSGAIVDPAYFKPLLLAGGKESDRHAVMELACGALDRVPWAMRAADIPTTAGEREQLTRLCNREALLTAGAFYIQASESDSAEIARHVAAFAAQIRVPVAIEVPTGSSLEQLDGVRINIPGLEYDERKVHWAQSLGGSGLEMNGQLDRITDGFNFDRTSIHVAGALVRDAIAENPGAAIEDLAWDACRTHARRGLENLAQRIEPRSRWDDLVLPPEQTAVLHQLISQVQHRSTVHRKWGFAEKFGRGLGVAALFAGASGTGKTMAAEIISAELQRDLFQIDLSAIVSKYIGETEKNLRRIFDCADESGAVLLFDEADALFGKRSEVRDSHDRYANLEISYLLQRMETYRGVAILTTNMQHALDTAFMRRIRFIVQFPFPDASHRQIIWEKVFPAKAPLAKLDFSTLAKLNISGGMIRNIATHAAFLAAETVQPICMDHLLHAARAEYAKISKPLTASETGGWI
ncbi:MAG TPA: ATP-binding protein [Tepidisphaeraceae bacterium]|jgi:hypothetical protein|nr:ATP-binding protein [Tepidisphaeraceae bacterium]